MFWSRKQTLNEEGALAMFGKKQKELEERIKKLEDQRIWIREENSNYIPSFIISHGDSPNELTIKETVEKIVSHLGLKLRITRAKSERKELVDRRD